MVGCFRQKVTWPWRQEWAECMKKPEKCCSTVVDENKRQYQNRQQQQQQQPIFYLILMLCIKEIADMTEIDDTYQYTEREGREQYTLAGLTASTTRRIEAVFLNIYLHVKIVKFIELKTV